MGDNQEILDGLKIAMEAELTGYNFYKMSAENVTDPKAKEALSELAQEEMGHFNYLRHQYKSVLEKGNYDFAKTFIKKTEDESESPIFSAAIKDRIKDSHYEVSVLTIGMKLELEAMIFYRSCAEKADSAEAKQFYDELADWEQGHYKAFENELDILKDDYWAANDFVPM
ncbi:MAG: ferritin family protein [Deltaproteobacteria bacterium]|mgnify:FL=1|nr:ferritin family protein [Deltaproteobacteria bacterium]